MTFMTFLTGDLKYKDRIWLPIMECPKCGYKTTVTNICRVCMKKMVYTGKVRKFTGCNKEREYEPKNANEAQRLWIGHGVVFE